MSYHTIISPQQTVSNNFLSLSLPHSRSLGSPRYGAIHRPVYSHRFDFITFKWFKKSAPRQSTDDLAARRLLPVYLSLAQCCCRLLTHPASKLRQPARRFGVDFFFKFVSIFSTLLLFPLPSLAYPFSYLYILLWVAIVFALKLQRGEMLICCICKKRVLHFPVPRHDEALCREESVLVNTAP